MYRIQPRTNQFANASMSRRSVISKLRGTRETMSAARTLFLFACCSACCLPLHAEPFPDWPFFAFDNGVGRGKWTAQQQAATLAELRYDGIGYTGLANLESVLRSLDDHQLRMFSTYIPVELDADKPPFDPALPAAIKQLAAHKTALWLHVHGRSAAAEDLDDRAVTVLRDIAAMAEPAGLPVVLYPHTGFYVATCRDAIRLARKVDRANVGVSFNLCHFLKQSDEQQLSAVLSEAMPYLRLVSINGADSGETTKMGWDRLIQTLDRGSYDVRKVLTLLNEGGYRGPIGLQCYAVPGDISQNLQRSKQAWEKLQQP
ncbi:MAG: TIM barrel protein [Planctomycetia bacterium]|nr:TIM barrel protein [Planctomycetia bacterium]